MSQVHSHSLCLHTLLCLHFFFTCHSPILSFKLYFPDNVKALYRRAKAHVGAWNPDEAKNDFQKCLELDKNLTKAIQRDLEQLDQQIKLNDVETKLRYKNLFT